MNEEMEIPPGRLHRATQTGCCHWAPIAPMPPDEKDAARDSKVMPALSESPAADIEKKQG